MNPFDSKWLADYNAKRAAKTLGRPLNHVKPNKEVEKPVKVKLERKESKLEHDFEDLWKRLDGPPLEREFRFHATRKFRFDFAVLANSVAIELEGGIWINGAHNRGSHFISDATKYNLAGLAGWRVFRLTREMITKEHILPIIEMCKKQTKMLEELGI